MDEDLAEDATPPILWLPVCGWLARCADAPASNGLDTFFVAFLRRCSSPVGAARRWRQVLAADIRKRNVAESRPVRANSIIVVNHCATNQHLSTDAKPVRNSFGMYGPRVPPPPWNTLCAGVEVSSTQNTGHLFPLVSNAWSVSTVVWMAAHGARQQMRAPPGGGLCFGCWVLLGPQGERGVLPPVGVPADHAQQERDGGAEPLGFRHRATGGPLRGHV